MTSEKKLIKQARMFQEQALAEIYDTYSPGIYRYAIRLLGDIHLAEECVADTFYRYLQTLQSGGGPLDHLQAYLYRIAHNWITDFYRRQPPAPLPLLDILPDTDNDLQQTMTSNMDKQAIRHALMQLTSDQRQVIILKYLEGWENQAVAEYMEKPIGAVKALQHRGILALRRLLLPKEKGDAENK
jgi:RNA polymerase sigma-70 factor (ECF subfamily)